MSTLPLPESILLEIHQSLGGQNYQTAKKTKFTTGQSSLSAHNAMGEEILHAIFDMLDMDPRARIKALDNFMEFANAFKELELNTWTFAADQRQIVWMLLGHFYVPGLARHVGFWSLEQELDKGMPGGRFWYLPEPYEADGRSSLQLPVTQVVDWLLDLLGMPLETFADQRSESTDGGHDGLRRSLYNWRNGTTIRPDTIQKYFAEETVLDFKGTFSIDSNRTLAEQFSCAQDFIKCKNLTADKLRIEIPMTQAGRLEAILNGSAEEDEQVVFIQCLADRYAAPSLRTIRQRLLLARMMQDGYLRLLKFLCPGVDPQCADARKNKLLQLFAIYKLVYNGTVDAWRNCRNQGEAAENVWFENSLPEWDKYGLFLSILPSRPQTANLELAQLLTRRFYDEQSGAELEDLIGLDLQSATAIIKRNAERSTALADELNSALHLAERIKKSSPWRALQGEHRYWVISQVVQDTSLSERAKKAAIQRLRELAATPAETAQAILPELSSYLNGERKHRPKDTRDRVQALLDEAEASDGYELWKAAILQYKAKHLLACNDFDGASKLFREALEAGRERNCGMLLGEVARDCLAVALANHKLIINNHEKYYRDMLADGMMAECKEIPPIEDTARWACSYFWDDLYKPYPGVPAKKPHSVEVMQKAVSELMELFSAGDQGCFYDWIKANRQLLKSNLPEVEGNSVLMLLLKTHSGFQRMIPMMQGIIPPELQNETSRFEAMLGNWQQFIERLAKESPKQLNIPDLKGQTPLMLMAEAGDTQMTKLMLLAGADPEIQDWQGMTALHSAIKSHVNSCVDALLDHPCQLNKNTCDGQSPLHTASWSANEYAVKRLLQLAPELAWQRNAQGRTPLEAVEFLIEYPEALNELNRHLAHNGRQPPSKQALEGIAQLLEQAEPVQQA
ncbi:MAG: ankyrin repeat domain-containing protein [Vibrionaceae bacterium]|nr:MAG: ankyrin repeat domain-containing protein [Vibrionaceae bacterium]